MIAGSSFSSEDRYFCCTGVYANWMNNSMSRKSDGELKEISQKVKRDAFSYIQFAQLSEELVEQASFGLTDLTVDNGLRNRVPKTCADHVHVRQNC